MHQIQPIDLIVFAVLSIATLHPIRRVSLLILFYLLIARINKIDIQLIRQAGHLSLSTPAVQTPLPHSRAPPQTVLFE